MKLNEAEMRMAYQIESTDPNAVLNEIYMTWRLSRYMAEYAEKFNCGNRRKINPAFKKKLDVCRGKEQRLKRNLSKMSVEEKRGLNCRNPGTAAQSEIYAV